MYSKIISIFAKCCKLKHRPGRYKVVFENLDPEKATFLTKNYSVMHGPARWLSKKYLEIYDES
jgi:hypothetical protein